MATTPEGKVKKLVAKRLAAEGKDVWAFWPVSNGMGVHGIPDCIGCYRGIMFGIEVKAPGRRGHKDRGCSKLQVMQLTKIHGAGGGAFVVDDAESMEEAMQALKRRAEACKNE